MKFVSRALHLFLATRPETLLASACPVLLGTAIAFGDGVHNFSAAAWCLVTAVCLQAGTNVANDFFDFKNGADRHERSGFLRPEPLKDFPAWATKLFFALFFLIGALGVIHLSLKNGWGIAALGALAIGSGFFYTAGPKPLGYFGLGDFLVFLFFGPVAVAGTYYVQSHEMNCAVLLAGVSPGLLANGILIINNIRDVRTDALAKKKTSTVIFGKAFSQKHYLAAIFIACLLPLLIVLLIDDHQPLIIAALPVLLSIGIIPAIFEKTEEPAAMNQALAATGQMLLVFTILFSIGWNWEILSYLCKHQWNIF
ncbi:MAG: 1,4-dihydroxy-2-naphthoate octaprenyltransferase [Candidatus Omnitrophica bacterium]|nr:1,4-dihydroxy-2-naphthoate octaprenyltransferase [Candidatus Omnitrophota bacterium]